MKRLIICSTVQKQRHAVIRLSRLRPKQCRELCRLVDTIRFAFLHLLLVVAACIVVTIALPIHNWSAAVAILLFAFRSLKRA